MIRVHHRLEESFQILIVRAEKLQWLWNRRHRARCRSNFIPEQTRLQLKSLTSQLTLTSKYQRLRGHRDEQINSPRYLMLSRAVFATPASESLALSTNSPSFSFSSRSSGLCQRKQLFDHDKPHTERLNHTISSSFFLSSFFFFSSSFFLSTSFCSAFASPCAITVEFTRVEFEDRCAT